jgi:guanine deaminase
VNSFMKAAYDEAAKNLETNDGGPFGAVIIKDGEIVVAARNMVVATNDPTMHAEIAAIRAATAKLGRFHLEDCEIYSTCEPCPMCMGAIMWARIPTVYYGADRKDAEGAGFADNEMYEYFEGTAARKKVTVSVLDSYECAELFERWNKKADRTQY